MALQDLYGLDRSLVNFPDQLNQFFHDGNHAERIQALPESDLAELLDYLNDVLPKLDHTSQPFRKCIQMLQKICGLRATLPLSYKISVPPSFVSEQPVAFGGFCNAYKGKAGTGTDVCIKEIRIYDTDDIGQLKQSFCREAAVWKHLIHPNIVPFLGVTLEPLQLVSEWMPGGELRNYLRNNPDTDLINLLLGIAEGLAYLHSCNVIHADLKGPNIMINESGIPRIGDFGVSTIARNPHSPESTCGEDKFTARWCAPEILKNGQPASKESDIFAFGMVIIEVFTGKAPFGERRTPEVMASIVTGKIPERPNHARFTDGLWELTQRCLKPTPSDRPHAEEVLVALKEIAGTNRVGTQESKTSSPLSFFSRNPTARNPPVRQRRNAGARAPEILIQSLLLKTPSVTLNLKSQAQLAIEKYQTGEKFDDESIFASDNTRGTRPGSLSVVPFPVKNFYGPPHLLNLPKNAEKVPLGCPESDSFVTVSTLIQPGSQPRSNTKKHRLWYRINSTCGVTSDFSAVKLMIGSICCVQ